MPEIIKNYWYFLLSMFLFNGALLLYLAVQLAPLKHKNQRKELMTFALKCVVAGFSTDIACLFNLYISSRIIYWILLSADMIISFIIIRSADSFPLYSYKDDE